MCKHTSNIIQIYIHSEEESANAGKWSRKPKPSSRSGGNLLSLLDNNRGRQRPEVPSSGSGPDVEMQESNIKHEGGKQIK